jgi:hypothetical protein
VGTRTVRLDDEAEAMLEEIRQATGLTISGALKEGLLALRDRLRRRVASSSWEVYEKLDLGPGGYARAPADRSGRAVREIIRRKHRR